MEMRWRVSFERRSDERGGEIRKERSYKTDQTDFAEEILALGGVAPVSPGTGVTWVPSPKQNPEFEALFIPDAHDRIAMIAPQLGLLRPHKDQAPRNERLGFAGPPQDGS